MVKKTQSETISYIDEEGSELEGKVKKLKKKLKQCRQEKEEYLSQAQRARADFLNYQKRQEERVEEFKKYSISGLVSDCLGVLESLEKAAEASPDMAFIKNQLENTLKNYGLKEIEALGAKFDPNYHEAVQEVSADGEPGVIVDVIQKGYLLYDKLLRPARVIVAK